MPEHRRVLFIANGNGEDSIAAEIIRRLPSHLQASAYPVIGRGLAFEDLCPVVGPRAEIASAGWRHQSGSVARDVRSGMFGVVPPAVRFLRVQRGVYDRVVDVGDLVGPILCGLARLPIDIYLDVFKVGQAHTYSAFDRFVIGRTAGKVYCRDTMLAQKLIAAEINATSAGNVMLDCVPRADYDVAARRQHKLAITLLPGSREWTGESLQMQLAALRLLPDDLNYNLFVALAAGLDAEALARETGLTYVAPATSEAADAGTLAGDGFTLHLARGALANLVEGADLVLSQAGTATQQALGLGKPVITFDRKGNRPKRMRDEQALMGEARILTPPDAHVLSREIQRLLHDQPQRERLGAIGRERLGGPGTIDAVIADLQS